MGKIKSRLSLWLNRKATSPSSSVSISLSSSSSSPSLSPCHSPSTTSPSQLDSNMSDSSPTIETCNTTIIPFQFEISPNSDQLSTTWETILSPTFMECFLTFLKKPRSAVNFAVTCKTLFNLLSPFICSHFFFRQPDSITFTYYRPTKWNKVHTLTPSMAAMPCITHIKGTSSVVPFVPSLSTLPSALLPHPPVLPPLLSCLECGPWERFLSSYPPSLSYLSYGGCSGRGDAFSPPWMPRFPVSLTHFAVHDGFNGAIQPLPPNLTHLVLGARFDKPVDFPPSITHLKLGARYKKQFTPPPNLIFLELGTDFRYNITLPPTLTHLILGSAYEQNLDLPPSLIYLVCNQTIFRASPPTLKEITLLKKDTNDFLPQIQDFLPLHTSLTHITLSADLYFHPCTWVPDSLTHIIFGSEFNQDVSFIGPSLTHISFGYYFNKPVPNWQCKPLYLSFGESFNQPIDSLPSTITHLVLGQNFNQPVINLPPNLISLTLGTTSSIFDQPIDKLPSTLKYLVLGDRFNGSVDSLPETLKHLAIGNSFNRSVDNLPPRLTRLSLGNSFNHSISFLPSSLKYLTVGQRFNQEVQLPPKIVEFKHTPVHILVNAKSNWSATSSSVDAVTKRIFQGLVWY